MPSGKTSTASSRSSKLLKLAWLPMTWPVLASVYVCDVLHVYDVENGELVRAQNETSYIRTWPKIVFDDDTGIFKYGREGRWTEEHMRVLSKGTHGFSASGYYMHNGTIFSAIVVKSWAKSPSFIWTAGAVGDVYTGTCQVFGNLG